MVKWASVFQTQLWLYINRKLHWSCCFVWLIKKNQFVRVIQLKIVNRTKSDSNYPFQHLKKKWNLFEMRTDSRFPSLLKVPLLWIMKGSYFGFESPRNNRLTCMQDQKTLSLSYNMHLFLPYLLNDSQTIRSTINFSKPLLYVTLICVDWSNCSISFPFHKAVFVSAVLLCVQPLPGKQLFLRSKSGT